ncbi:MBL fold metallo-hydrolase [Anaerobacillus sp. CMMVII]|uniref:MBL fold metallo-hydrolase n=1 Tax=Anaerobacillus sp. CMMVII TaxID=2755588 RepID=UPI0021B72469|nr:MBL fold metallo-hydrolase [Anaerobacillus sp. CMMVII]MCT8139320.1 MBL fold metallo-hydrolase [Anaerobacillus sp. CMMVII]
MTAGTTVKGISVQELTKKVINGERLFILDVRNETDFDNWKIEGENVEIINKPYFELMDGLEAIVDKLPKNEPIYVVCAKTGSSEFVAGEIAEAGYSNVFYMEGGMKGWSEYLEPIKVGNLSNGAIHQFVRIGKGCLSYLIESEGKAIIVDTNRMIEQYEAFLTAHNLKLEACIDTHLHADHISGGKRLTEKCGGTYYLPEKDAGEVTFSYEKLEDQAEISVGSITVKALYSPGHTIGSTSLIVDDKFLLTGDILFIDSIGRPDLAGKAEDWVNDLRETLYQRYKTVAAELTVLPAHFMGIKEMNKDGSISEKLGVLYQENHGLNIGDADKFRRTVTENLPPQPNAYQEIRQTNMGKINPDEEAQREMEIGPNRCAVRE